MLKKSGSIFAYVCICVRLFICLVFSVGNQTQGFAATIYMLNHGAIPQPAFLKGSKGIYPQPRNSGDLFEHIPKDRQVLN